MKARVHASLIAHGHPYPVSDLLRTRGRSLIEGFTLPAAWRASTEASLLGIAHLDTHLDTEIAACEPELRRPGAAHPYVLLLMTAPGIASVLTYTIAAAIREIEPFAGPKKLCGYTGLCP